MGVDIRENHLVMGKPHFILLCMFEHTQNEVYFPIKTISMLRFSSLSSNVYNSWSLKNTLQISVNSRKSLPKIEQKLSKNEAFFFLNP